MLGHYTLQYISHYIFHNCLNSISSNLFYTAHRCKNCDMIGPWLYINGNFNEGMKELKNGNNPNINKDS